MTGVLLINPRYEALVRRHGLDRFDYVMNWAGDLVSEGHAKRDVARIQVEDAGVPVRFFLKRERSTYLKDRFRSWADGLGWGTKARREWHTLEAMATVGIGCPELVVMAESGGFRPQSYLILREIPGVSLLSNYLAERQSSTTVQFRRQLAAHLGHEVARLHEAGINHPDLYSKHILLSEDGPESSIEGRVPRGEDERNETGIEHRTGKAASVPRPSPRNPQPFCLPHVWIIDVQRSSVGRPLTASQRVIDLAALDATTPRALASATDRLVFMESYLSHLRAPLDTERLIRAIRQRSRRLGVRRKIREMQQFTPQPSVSGKESWRAVGVSPPSRISDHTSRGHL